MSYIPANQRSEAETLKLKDQLEAFKDSELVTITQQAEDVNVKKVAKSILKRRKKSGAPPVEMLKAISTESKKLLKEVNALAAKMGRKYTSV